jgi:hypothetical protein
MRSLRVHSVVRRCTRDRMNAVAIDPHSSFRIWTRADAVDSALG